MRREIIDPLTLAYTACMAISIICVLILSVEYHKQSSTLSEVREILSNLPSHICNITNKLGSIEGDSLEKVEKPKGGGKGIGGGKGEVKGEGEGEDIYYEYDNVSGGFAKEEESDDIAKRADDRHPADLGSGRRHSKKKRESNIMYLTQTPTLSTEQTASFAAA